MKANGDERLEDAAATLNGLIALMREQGLNETAQFLAMATLNLLMHINGISDEELRALCAALERGPGSRQRRGGWRASGARRKGAPALPAVRMRLGRVAAPRPARSPVKS